MEVPANIPDGASYAKNRIVIIGHGKSPMGKGWGEKIDACDYVIRMWDNHWQNEADYGTKYDYGFFEAHPSMMPHFWQHKQRDPTEGWAASLLFHSPRAYCQMPEGTELIDQAPWAEIGEQLGGMGETGRLQFTRGTIAACWAIENSEPGDQIILVGYDNIHAGTALPVRAGFPEEYLEQQSTFSFNGYKPGRKYGNHDFQCENPVMQHLAKKHNVTVTFAQDIW